MTLKQKQTLATAIRWIGTILSLGLFAWLVSHQRWDVALTKAAGIALWASLLALLMYFLSYGFNTLRWCILLWAQDVKITFWQAFRMTWAGNFASNFLPSTIGGDGLRMVGIFRYTQHKTVGIGSVVLDRIINMTAMLCLLPLPFLVFGSSLLSPQGALALPAGLQKLFERYFPKVMSAVQVWASHPWTFVYAFLAAWPSNLLPMAATWLIARQLGMDVSFWQVAAVQTVTYFLSVLPISVNGIGLRETAYTTFYTLLGATLEQASTLALVTRFLTLLVTVPGALWLSGAVTDAALNDDELQP
jgi:uncharacterized membrane protein YbhN (UPF0104 family)